MMTTARIPPLALAVTLVLAAAAFSYGRAGVGAGTGQSSETVVYDRGVIPDNLPAAAASWLHEYLQDEDLGRTIQAAHTTSDRVPWLFLLRSGYVATSLARYEPGRDSVFRQSMEAVAGVYCAYLGDETDFEEDDGELLLTFFCQTSEEGEDDFTEWKGRWNGGSFEQLSLTQRGPRVVPRSVVEQPTAASPAFVLPGRHQMGAWTASFEDGEVAFALVRTAAGTRLERRSVAMTEMDREGGITVSSAEDDVVLYVKGVGTLEERDVPTVHDEARVVDVGETVAGSLADCDPLRIQGRAHEAPGIVELVLSCGEREQQLATYPRDGNGVGEWAVLHWVGDLDGDGRPDVVMRPPHHYGRGAVYHLLLSTEASAGGLVGLAAGFISPPWA